MPQLENRMVATCCAQIYRNTCRCINRRLTQARWRRASAIAGSHGTSGHATSRRQALAAALLAGLLGGRCLAAEEADPTAVMPVYFGNGCFWGRQKNYVDAEQRLLGRKGENISAVVGYAGGKSDGSQRVCYYTGQSDSVYERLGHAEVVQLDLSTDQAAAAEQMRVFADTFFKQFRRTRLGMQRLDPQDAGPGYRNVIGIPGGIKSPLFKVLEARNVNGMRLVAGSGNEPGQLREGDELNTVYILDSTAGFPFHRAEEYHQYHNGIGTPFPADYRVKQKLVAKRAGRIAPTGCPEITFF